jgi:hypothetical protein
VASTGRLPTPGTPDRLCPPRPPTRPELTPAPPVGRSPQPQLASTELPPPKVEPAALLFTSAPSTQPRAPPTAPATRSGQGQPGSATTRRRRRWRDLRRRRRPPSPRRPRPPRSPRGRGKGPRHHLHRVLAAIRSGPRAAARLGEEVGGGAAALGFGAWRHPHGTTRGDASV